MYRFVNYSFLQLMCSLAYYEGINNYVCNDSNVLYIAVFDASQHLARVHYGKLFNI